MAVQPITVVWRTPKPDDPEDSIYLRQRAIKAALASDKNAIAVQIRHVWPSPSRMITTDQMHVHRITPPEYAPEDRRFDDYFPICTKNASQEASGKHSNFHVYFESKDVASEVKRVKLVKADVDDKPDDGRPSLWSDRLESEVAVRP